MNGSCSCSAAPKLVFPCSGGSDVDAVSDQAIHRRWSDWGMAKVQTPPNDANVEKAAANGRSFLS